MKILPLQMEILPLQMEILPLQMEITPLQMEILPLQMKITPLHMEITPLQMKSATIIPKLRFSFQPLRGDTSQRASRHRASLFVFVGFYRTVIVLIDE